VIRELASQGVGIVYISHRLEELLGVADEVTVLRDGCVVGHGVASQIDVPWIVSRMTGRDGQARVRAARTQVEAPDLLTIESFSLPARVGRAALHHITLSVRPGEIVGVYGLMGSGRTELFESILGVHRDGRGRIVLGGRDLHDLDVHARVEAGVFLAPEDRKASGLIPTMTVGENITLSSVDALSSGGYLSTRREAEEAGRLRDRLRIKCATLSSPITSLSGGNQQKTVLARGLLKRPTLMLLDEPTRGVDVGARAEILNAMRDIAAAGTAVVFSSSDLGEVLEGADRVIVLSGGRVAAVFARGAAGETDIASAASAPARSARG
jgi:erythritol transport system ATP-binding protein